MTKKKAPQPRKAPTPEPARPAAATRPPAPDTARPAATATAREKPKPPAQPATRQSTGPLKVRATRLGYYDHARRHVGDVFTIAKAQDFGTWMEWVDPATAERVTTANESIRRQHDDTLAMRHGGVPSADSGRTPMNVGDDGDNDNPLGE